MKIDCNEALSIEIDALGKCVSLLKAVNQSCGKIPEGDLANSLDVLTQSFEDAFINIQNYYNEIERKEFLKILKIKADEDDVEDATVELDSVIQGWVKNGK